MGVFYYLCGNKKGRVMNNQTIETLTIEEIGSACILPNPTCP